MLQQYTKKLLNRSDLSEAEAEQCLELILHGGTSEVVVASFLTALANKGEKPNEIAGFARVMRKNGVHIKCEHPKLIDTAGTGGGIDTFNISTAAAFVIVGAGVAVAKHGNRAVTSRCGSADILDALGVQIDRPPEVSERALNEFGIAFMFAPLFHPAMKKVAPVRRSLGHRTIFNMLGPLTNPAAAPYQLIGVYSPDLTVTIGEALSHLDCERAWVVHSYDGLDELSIGSSARVTEVSQNKVNSFDFDPLELGFQAEAKTLSDLAGGTPEENADLILGILSDRVKTGARRVVILNAAAALYIAGEDDFPKAIRKAEESIVSGAARQKLADLVHAYETF